MQNMYNHNIALYEPRREKTGYFCICENKDADQLRGNREADQRLCFRYTNNTILLLSKSEISSLKLSSVAVQPGLCRTRSETPKTGFLTTRLIYITSDSDSCRFSFNIPFWYLFCRAFTSAILSFRNFSAN